jgi:hypothetical protein
MLKYNVNFCFDRCPGSLLKRDQIIESSSRFRPLIEHDLFGEPLRTFPDHALALQNQIAPDFDRGI